MLRVGMTNPPYILEHLEAMGEILSHPRVYAFLHVPVQSGSDAVLTDMRREYCRDDFRRVASVLRERVRGGVTIATDVICGFPTETPEDFLETLSLIEEFKFPSLFINQFFPRPGTPAAKMERVDPQVKNGTCFLFSFFLLSFLFFPLAFFLFLVFSLSCLHSFLTSLFQAGSLSSWLSF